jgi:hypothetical protein
MPSKNNSSPQAKKQLSKLKSLGLYAGDLRKKISSATMRLIKRFDAVLTGKATVVTPANPAKFKGIFDVKGDKVIVPRRVGEKITVDKKTGEIVSKRKVGDRTVTARGKQIKRGETIKKPTADKVTRTQYAIPFSTNSGTHWMRFPTWDELQKFMAGYDYKGWQDYVVVEQLDKPLTDAQLERRAKRQRAGKAKATGGRRGKRDAAKKSASRKKAVRK